MAVNGAASSGFTNRRHAFPPVTLPRCSAGQQSHRCGAASTPLKHLQRRTRLVASAAAAPEPGPPSHETASLFSPPSSSPSSHHHPASLGAIGAPLIPHVTALFTHLRDRANSFSHHLHTSATAHAISAGGHLHLAFNLSPPNHGPLGMGGLRLPGLGLGLGLGNRAKHGGSGHHTTEPSMHVPPSVSPRAAGPPPPALPQQELQERWDDGHSWGPNLGPFLPWIQNHGDATSNTSSSSSAGHAASPVATATTAASPATATPPVVLPVTLLMPPALAALHSALAARVAGLAFLWQAAVSFQQRTVSSAMQRVNEAAEAAGRARRSLPPPRDLPTLVRYTAASAAVHAEESLALALSHVAAGASAAAAGVPAAAAAVTGSTAAAAAAGAMSAPHLPLLRTARRRLSAAAAPLLEKLRGLQRGCTTHVLLRFLLYSALQPRLRRDLLVQLDVLARRAEQLALLQDQHDAWAARQPALLAGNGPNGANDANGFNDLNGASLQQQRQRLSRRFLHPLQGRNPPSSPSSGPSSRTQPTSAGPGGRPTTAPGVPSASGAGRMDGGGGALSSSSAPSLPPLTAATEPLSARWFSTVFAAEMRACSRQLDCDGAAASPPDDAAAGDPPGRFDLRDLYRLIRVLEVASEDLDRYA